MLKESEFQDRILLSKQFLPDYSFPIADVKDHKLLPDGKYFNLWTGFDVELINRTEKEIEFEDRTKTFNVKKEIKLVWDHYNKILGEDNWNNISQYTMCLRPGQKHSGAFNNFSRGCW